MSTQIERSRLEIRPVLARLCLRLRRPAGSGGFVAEIDGLRFFAILPVVLDHSWWAFKANVGDPGFMLTSPIGRIFSAGELGVQLFFVISGYVLGLGFYKAAQGGRGVDFCGYLKRRLRRLEPPFLLIMTAFFLLLLSSGKLGVVDGFRHYLASITYLHGLIYHLPSSINTVTWSLEVELQFYILAPALYFFYRLSSSMALGLMALGCVAFVVTAHMMGDYYLSLLSHAHFFLLDADFPILDGTSIAPRWAALFPGALFAFFMIEANYASMLGNLSKICLLAVIFALALGCDPIRRFLSTPFLFVVGGACYSIYLIHYPLLSAFSKVWSAIGAPGGFVLYVATALVIVLIVSLIFYLIAERPFMTRTAARHADNQRT